MKYLKKLLAEYKIQDSCIIKKYKKYYLKYKELKLEQENNQLIYEVSFFYLTSGISFKYKDLELTYGIKARIFQNATNDIKNDLKDFEEEEEENFAVCNLYAITKNIDDYRLCD